MMRKIHVSGVLSPSYPKQKGKRITRSQVNLGTVNFVLIGWRGGWFHLFWRGVNAEERVLAGFLSGLQRFASLSYTSLYFRGTTFSIVEDTQLLLSERKEGIYAYVSQHLVFVIFMPLFWVDHK